MSSESDDSDLDEQYKFDNSNKNLSSNTVGKNTIKSNDSIEAQKKSDTSNGFAKINLNKIFLPDFDTDKEIKDALSYFCCTKQPDELRREWVSNREKLVEVC